MIRIIFRMDPCKPNNIRLFGMVQIAPVIEVSGSVSRAVNTPGNQ